MNGVPPAALGGDDAGRPDHHDQEEANNTSSSDPAATNAAHARSRKFVIQSTFGNPRERRSRKNRPCDACRRRKTACVITSEPPCLFCESRGIPCQSTPVVGLGDGQQPQPGEKGASAPAQHQQRQPFEAPAANQQVFPLPGVRKESNDLLTPSTGHESPAGSAASPYGVGMVIDQPAHTPSYRDPAALIHQNLVYHSSPSTVNSDPHRAADTASVISVTSPEAAPQTHSLEDIPGRCAYFMGPTSEQDGFLLDAFRYGILSEKYNLDANIAQVHPGSSLRDDQPVHFLFLEIGHPDHVNRARQDASDSIEAKVWPYGENLVRLYFRHVHPVFPIVSKVRFLRRYQVDKKSIPACLRGAIYALASVFWSCDVALRGTPVPFQQHELVDYAHQALRREIENPNLFVLQACLLLIHVTPPTIDSIEAPTTWTLAAQATACAQMIGLHLEPGQWNINATEKHLRRKLWWATFYSDCWSSICFGNPPHIASTSYNTAPLTMEDVRCDEDVPEDLQYLVEPPDTSFEVSTGARFMQMIHIVRSLRTVLDSSFQVNTSARTINDTMEAQNELVTVQAKLRDWTSLIPSCLVVQKDERVRSHVTSYNCPLHLSFYAAQVLLYRALMHPPTRQAKTTPSSNLRRWFPEALIAFEAFVDFLSCVNKADLFGFWGRHARSQLILCGNFLVFLFLLASERRDIERAYRLLESFHGTMHALYDVDHVQINTLLRAATIRIDSFFSQAAEIMRGGGDGSISAAKPNH
ncbi:hypothetical protein PLIIFM63780_010029 [Purpureocillium lilacinum]|uniref:Transcriptional regulator family: Fungal Specific TF n=1 Tax=Purpureocillium lilacinum TaxID=33203 RepID=A0A179GBQ1_PURLI|nr:transcriptional regulator family: Fungal Specific TF [Purpureocillium lilacinum]OAQ75247.1 Zn(II)2Cys6 transcription factor [Purpureocillium lilacinum]GJN86449.1 hypothetical protein PLIIFM63780_010029 [Purpureocillium lilacinum]